jgi:predicted N-formylglutamate amidohydrolase
MNSKWVITCEHGGNHIPPAYTAYFQDAHLVLQSHRGYDPGALALFRRLADQLADFSQYSQTSRLLVELNRSLHHKNLFSVYTKSLDAALKKEVIASYYLPYRQLVEQKIKGYLDQAQQVIHLSIHSFTPELNGEIRKADIGLLFDPARTAEKAFCRAWKNQLREIIPQAIVRFNYPYQGKADGFTTYLRRRYTQHYMGIELELNQKYSDDSQMQEAIFQSLLKLKANRY